MATRTSGRRPPPRSLEGSTRPKRRLGGRSIAGAWRSREGPTPFIRASRHRVSRLGRLPAGGGPNVVGESCGETPSIKGQPRPIVRRLGMAGAPMGGAGSQIALRARARVVRDARRAQGCRSGCRRSSIPRPGSGRQRTSSAIASGRSATTRRSRIGGGVSWAVGAVVGAGWAPGGRRAAGLSGPAGTRGMCLGRVPAAVAVPP